MDRKSSMSLFNHVTLLSLSLSIFAQPAAAFFRMGAKVIVSARVDPIINPGAVSMHVHNVVGGNAFAKDYDYATQRASTCTSVDISVDKSAYWAPALYYVNNTDSTFSRIPSYYNIYYLDRLGSKDTHVRQWPAGLKMVGGNPNRRTNAGTVADKAVSFVCLDYTGKLSGQIDKFFDHNCPDGMRAQVVFPSCWDGVNLDSADHSSHMSYPTGANPDSGDCPSTHPVRLITLFYEQVFSVGDFPYHGDGTWALANGDTTGYGFHGDFVNGWDASENSILQQAMDTCHNLSGNIEDCPPLVPFIDRASKETCKYLGNLPDEKVDVVPALPGCNPLWVGTGPKPTCSGTVTNPPYVPVKLSVLPTGWSETGCYTEGTGSRALKSATLTDAQSMTKQMCVEFCASKGFSLAGVEWSQECYCGNALSAGSVPAPAGDCSNTCKGNVNEICGGSSRITLFTYKGTALPTSSSSSASSVKPSSTSASSSKSTGVSTSTSVVRTSSTSSTVSTAVPTSTSSPSTPNTPSGWKYFGCTADSYYARTLIGETFSDDAMTTAKCGAFCLSKGYTIMGTEYGKECWCGDNFSNGGGTVLDDSQCSQACTGAPTEKCGGTARLSTYKLQDTIATVSSDVTTGWSLLGCVAEPSSGRLLQTSAMVNKNMTPGTCTSYCASKGYSIAGIEWTEECYCGNSFSTGATLSNVALLDDTTCKYHCPGALSFKCGGDRALTIYSSGSGHAKRHRRALRRHLGSSNKN